MQRIVEIFSIYADKYIYIYTYVCTKHTHITYILTNSSIFNSIFYSDQGHREGGG